MSKLSDAVKKFKALASHPEKAVLEEVLDAMLEHLDGMAAANKKEKKE